MTQHYICKILYSWGLLLALGLFWLAGCAGPAGGMPAPPTPPLPATPAQPAIRVALLAPARGELATFGRLLRNGMLLAVQETNDRGGVLSYRLEAVSYDADCDFEQAGQATRQAVAEGARFILGPLCSDAAIGAAVAAETAGALLIAPTATHPLVTLDDRGETRPTVFRGTFVSSWQARAIARFARETLAAGRAAVLTASGDDYETALVDAFIESFTAGGGQVVYRATYPPGETDFTAALTASQAAGADVLYLPAVVPVANRVAGQLPAASEGGQPGPVLLGSDRWQSDDLDLEATTGSYFTVHFSPAEARPAVQSWVESYQAAYAIKPDPLAALGYDAAALLVAAMRRAGSFEVPAVAGAMEQLSFDGVTGQITFDRQHNTVRGVPVMRVEAGKIVFAASVLP